MITCQMRCRGVNSLGWFWNRSPPARAQPDPTPGDYFCQMWWWRCSCLRLCPLPLGDEFWEGSCGGGSAYHEQPQSLPASQGVSRRRHESQVQSHQAGQRARFQALLGTLVDNEGRPTHRVSPVTPRQSTHKSVSARSDYLMGKQGQVSESARCWAKYESAAWKENSKQAEKCQNKSMVAQREVRAS